MKIESGFRCEVDRNIPLKELVERGEYGGVSSHIWAFEPFFSVSEIAPPKETNFCIVGFPYDVYEADVLKEMPTMGLRPADIIELLTFSAKFRHEIQQLLGRDVELLSAIYALGTKLAFGGMEIRPFVGKYEGEFILGNDTRKNGYFDICGDLFLAVRD